MNPLQKFFHDQIFFLLDDSLSYGGNGSQGDMTENNRDLGVDAFS